MREEEVNRRLYSYICKSKMYILTCVAVVQDHIKLDLLSIQSYNS